MDIGSLILNIMCVCVQWPFVCGSLDFLFFQFGPYVCRYFLSFIVADTLLCVLSHGHPPVFPCAVSSVTCLQILQKCVYKGQ